MAGVDGDEVDAVGGGGGPYRVVLAAPLPPAVIAPLPAPPLTPAAGAATAPSSTAAAVAAVAAVIVVRVGVHGVASPPAGTDN